MRSFIVIAALALTAAQATVLSSCGSGLGFGLGGLQVGGLSSGLGLGGLQVGGLSSGLGLGLRGIQVSGASSTPLAPRVVADSCQCSKTIVRPQLNQRVIDVPSTRRVVQNSISNTVQNIPYSAAGPVDTGLVGAGAGYGYGLGAGLAYGADAGLAYGAGAIDTVAPISTGYGIGAGYGLGAGLGYGLGAVETVAPIATGFSGYNGAILGGNAISTCGY